MAQDKADIDAALKAAHAKYKGLKEGKTPTTSRRWPRSPSNLFGIALVTVDGQVYTVGDVDQLFSIQSISKVFTMAEVFQEQRRADGRGQRRRRCHRPGVQLDRRRRAVQGQGDEPVRQPRRDRHHQHGEGRQREEIWDKIIGIYSAFAGRRCEVNQEVYKSESDTNQRNQAIGMLMYAYGRIKENPARATDLYTRQCSVNVNAKDLATMAATLANGGDNPVTKKTGHRRRATCPAILAVMATAGLYDDSGKWLFHTGLPAKSGVGGGIIAVSPGKFGIAAFSPPLDAAGNSVRGPEGDRRHLRRARRQSLRRHAPSERRADRAHRDRHVT